MEIGQKVNLVLFFIIGAFVKKISTQQTDVHTSGNSCVTTVIIAVIGSLLAVSVIGNVVCLLLVIMKKQKVGPTFVPVTGPVKQPTTLDSAGVWV